MWILTESLIWVVGKEGFHGSNRLLLMEEIRQQCRASPSHSPEEKEAQRRDSSSPDVIIDVADSEVEQPPDGLVVAGATVGQGDGVHARPAQDRVFVSTQAFYQRVCLLQTSVHGLWGRCFIILIHNGYGRRTMMGGVILISEVVVKCVGAECLYSAPFSTVKPVVDFTIRLLSVKCNWVQMTANECSHTAKLIAGFKVCLLVCPLIHLGGGEWTHEQSVIPPVICPKFHPYIQPPCQKRSQFLALPY